MSKALMGGHSWALRTESRTADAALVWDDSSFTGGPATTDRERNALLEPAIGPHLNSLHGSLASTVEDPLSKEKSGKQRFGLPAGFVSRLGRYGRTVLFEDNVYRLPTGIEFIPQPPAGTLGSRDHQYALLTPEQYVEGKRGSVYVRTDGRIFDYAFDHKLAERDLFDTGFTIHDLERTGRYAPAIKSRLASVRRDTNAGINKRQRRSRKGKR